jgi:hypothetical protein
VNDNCLHVYCTLRCTAAPTTFMYTVHYGIHTASPSASMYTLHYGVHLPLLPPCIAYVHTVQLPYCLFVCFPGQKRRHASLHDITASGRGGGGSTPSPLFGRCNHGRMNFKDTNPLMSPLLVTLFVVVKQFCRFYINLGRNREKTPAEYGLQHNSTPPIPPPPQSRTICLYCTFSLGRGGEVREKIEGQQYTSVVPLSMGATVHKLGRKYQP